MEEGQRVTTRHRVRQPEEVRELELDIPGSKGQEQQEGMPGSTQHQTQHSRSVPVCVGRRC